MISQLAFPSYIGYNASTITPIGYDGVMYLSSRGNYAYSSLIA
ncbi:MAG: hypothetical protein AB3A66_19445 [Nodularia sp. CChRGM 3473]